MRLTKQMVQRALARDEPWSIGNRVLYDLCRRYPRHTVDAEILAKVWLIGRAYAASIERGRRSAAGSERSNDRFYTEAVTRALRESRLDRKLGLLARSKPRGESRMVLGLETHAYLVELFRRLTGKSKRSLASKYLHFHLPDIFFIFDSRVVAGIRKLGIPAAVVEVPPGADPEYARFVGHAIGVREYVRSRFGEQLNPRQLDNLLLATVAAGNV
jgi:hypothetical protein